MPVFRLSEELIFPPPALAEVNGLLAVGGDLSEPRLLLAYSQGIFPWYSEGDPVLWWSPDPRLVLFPEELKVSRSLKQIIRKQSFTVTIDDAFEDVISSCAAVHGGKHGETWITDDMISAYSNLHRSGVAHSAEAWHNGRLAGGIYGISLGSVFFGESMFARVSNASKVAFVVLVQHLARCGFTLIDCQITTAHLVSLGAREIKRPEYLSLLKHELNSPAPENPWTANKLLRSEGSALIRKP